MEVKAQLPEFRTFSPIEDQLYPRTTQSTTVGGYEFIKTIGKGKFGKVKSARHKLTGEKVAIKIINKIKIDPDTLNMIRREIQIMKLLHHPYIIQLYEVKESRQYIYIIMEYASGGEIMDFIVAHGKLPEREARKFFRQIVDAVGYLHSIKACHRDLKASNLLLDANLNIRIIDFGLSNMFTVGSKLSTFCGSPSHASPELVQRSAYYGPEVDLWSLGVILFNLVTGYLPFDGRNFLEMFQRILKAEYVCPAYVSDECKDLIGRLLEKDSSKRATLEEKQLSSKLEEHNKVDEEVIAHLVEMGYEDALETIQNNQYNDTTATYYLLKDIKGRNAKERESDSQKVEKAAAKKMGHKRHHTVGVSIEVKSNEMVIRDLSPKETGASKPEPEDLSPPLASPQKTQRSEPSSPLKQSPQKVSPTSSQVVQFAVPEATPIETQGNGNDEDNNIKNNKSVAPGVIPFMKKGMGHRRSSSVDTKNNSNNSNQMTTNSNASNSKEERESKTSVAINKMWDGLKSSFSSLLKTTSDVREPKTKKAAFSTSTTSAKQPSEILKEIQRVLVAMGIQHEVTGFVVKCEIPEGQITFELEICKPPRLLDIYFIHPNRLGGSEWDYKNIVNQIISKLKL